MLLKDLEQRFLKVKNYSPSHVNELLDYLQSCYIHGDLSIVDYKNIFSELTKYNAEKPNDFFIRTKLFHFDMGAMC